MRMRRAAALVVGMTIGLFASQAGAQPQPPTSLANGSRLSASVYGGYDRPLFSPSANASLRPTGQTFGGVDMNLLYARPGRRVGLFADLGLSDRYYPKFSPSNVPSYGGSLTLSSNYRGRWQWNVGLFGHYAPFSAASVFATATTANAQSLAIANATAFQQSTVRQADVNGSAALSYSISRRTSVSLTGIAGALIPIDSTISRVERYTGTLRLSRSLTRALSGYVGYNLNQNRVAAQGTTPSNDILISSFDFGVEFARPIQIARGTTLGIHTGVVNVPGTRGKSYRLTGGATVDYSFGRRSTWAAQLAVMRDSRFVQSFRNSVSSTGVSLGAGGRVIGRFGTLFSTNYSSGTINSASSVPFTSYSGSATLRFDMLRRVAAFVEYAAFASDVDPTVVSGVGQPAGRFGRQGIRGGLSFGLSPFALVP